MAVVTVYDTEGIAHQKESVDATECVKELGWSTTAPEVSDGEQGEVSEPRTRKKRGE